jgi:perosamine synthetase
VVVHVFGNLADMEAIMDIAREFHLRVVEDATEALGSKFTTGRYAGKYAGTIGDFGAYSFNGNKIITTGGGGALTAQNPQELAHLRYLSTQAKDDPLFYVHNEVGYNYRMTNLQGALGVAQLEELPLFIQNKTRNYESYRKRLSDFRGGEILGFRPGTRPNYWFYSLVLSEEALEGVGDVKSLVTRLQQSGIQTRPIWGLIHQQKPYQGCYAFRVERACYYSKRVVNLPCSTQLTQEEIEAVASALEEILG